MICDDRDDGTSGDCHKVCPLDLIGRIGRVRVRLSSPEPAVATRIGPRLFCSLYASRLLATHPKDHVYALLGVAGIDLVPRYEDHIPVRRVYRDYVESWLKECYSGNTSLESLLPLKGELHFLSFAGIGMFDKPLQLPTWAPNFPECSRQPQLRDTTSFRNDSDINKLFPLPAAPAAIVSNYTLRCEGVYVDTITHLSGECSGALMDASLIDFFDGFVSRHNKRYASGMRPLQALLRALTFYGGEVIDDGFLGQALSVLDIILQAGRVRHPNFLATELGITCTPVDSFRGVLRNMFPEYRGSTRMWDKPLPRDSVGMLLVGMTGYRLYETSGGYLGLTREKTILGDFVCLLKGYWTPVVLRKIGDRYLFVNASFVAGLMHSEEVSAFIRARIPASELRWYRLASHLLEPNPAANHASIFYIYHHIQCTDPCLVCYGSAILITAVVAAALSTVVSVTRVVEVTMEV